MAATSSKRKSSAATVAKKTRAPKAKPRTTKRVAATERASTPPVRVPRRAIFVDVENTSSEVDLIRVLESLKIDRSVQPTDLAAVGNWKSVGQRLGRRVAAMGAQLVHSAPATGVRDWSDLWIAVAAGCWLGRAAPGDTLEIVSDDRAFDAVGDMAAALGVAFRRISHRTVGASPPVVSGEVREQPARRGRRHRRGRGPRTAPVRHTTPVHQAAPVPPSSTPTAAPPSVPADEAHAASQDQIIAAMTRLSGGSPERWINLDVLANALKAQGFTRPAGSPRLVTRLRKLKDLEVSPNGMVRLLAAGILSEYPQATSTVPPVRRRSRRRGGRRRTAHTDGPSEPSAPVGVEASGSESGDKLL